MFIPCFNPPSPHWSPNEHSSILGPFMQTWTPIGQLQIRCQTCLRKGEGVHCSQLHSPPPHPNMQLTSSPSYVERLLSQPWYRERQTCPAHSNPPSLLTKPLQDSSIESKLSTTSPFLWGLLLKSPTPADFSPTPDALLTFRGLPQLQLPDAPLPSRPASCLLGTSLFLSCGLLTIRGLPFTFLTESSPSEDSSAPS